MKKINVPAEIGEEYTEMVQNWTIGYEYTEFTFIQTDGDEFTGSARMVMQAAVRRETDKMVNLVRIDTEFSNYYILYYTGIKTPTRWESVTLDVEANYDELLEVIKFDAFSIEVHKMVH